MQKSQNIEVHPEEIPLQEILTTELPQQSTNNLEQRKHTKIRNLFDHYDKSNDGYLCIKEMKRLVKDHKASPEIDLPKCFVKNIFKIADTNNDGKLSFDEFYRLCTQKEWLFQSYAERYCKSVIPKRDRRQDEVMLYTNVCPPPMIMITFSVIQIIFFIVDVFLLEEHKEGNNGRPIGETIDGPAAQVFIYNPYKRNEVWRFLTYMFVHIGVMHLVMNLISK